MKPCGIRGTMWDTRDSSIQVFLGYMGLLNPGVSVTSRIAFPDSWDTWDSWDTSPWTPGSSSRGHLGTLWDMQDSWDTSPWTPGTLGTSSRGHLGTMWDTWDSTRGYIGTSGDTWNSKGDTWVPQGTRGRCHFHIASGTILYVNEMTSTALD